MNKKVVVLLVIPLAAALGFVAGRSSKSMVPEKKVTTKWQAKKGRFRFRGPKPAHDIKLSRAFVDKNLQDLPKILRDAKAVPYIKPNADGKVEGFKLVAVKPGSLYEKVGLQNGDIIVGSNGQAIDSPKQAMELYQSLKKQDSIEIQVIREGEKKNLNIQFE